MAIPFATHTVTITRPGLDEATRTAYDPTPPAAKTVASDVRAVLATPTASADLAGGDRVVWSTKMTSDVCTLKAEDVVTDDTGRAWFCLWAVKREGMGGISHMTASLRLVTGAT